MLVKLKDGYKHIAKKENVNSEVIFKVKKEMHQEGKLLYEIENLNDPNDIFIVGAEFVEIIKESINLFNKIRTWINSFKGWINSIFKK